MDRVHLADAKSGPLRVFSVCRVVCRRLQVLEAAMHIMPVLELHSLALAPQTHAAAKGEALALGRSVSTPQLW